ncbi:hypothetical protein FLP10_06915 [Agromyces intestinalis]|uniref:Pectate lyase superfamily protein domain-containing protein n=1 Tax=Agromyces intestinalis TaxID=2592652 RepID=A0A5C1YFD5_9MICO|nr:hypothetical protein [Agromyces intestinalis]QEO14180.1 hypothetical protein FLP10_06915 [Agromyces intestinalis]
MPDTRRAFLALTAFGGLGAVAAARAPEASAQAGSTMRGGAPGRGRPGASVTAADAGLVGDGATDDAPAIQAAFDAGAGAIDFEAGRTYLLDSPVFLDRGTYDQFVLNLDGATLKLGPNLPSTDAFWREPEVRWAVFPNTKRGAWSPARGTVTVDASTRASGKSVGALVSLTVRAGTIDGDGGNTGFSFANRTGSRFEGVVLLAGRALLSWADYSDLNVFVQCHNRAGGPANAVLVEQISSGDGLLMASCKADGSVWLARLKYSRGAEITGTVTGRIELDSCAGVRIGAAHQEAPVSNATMLAIRGSKVTVDTSVLYLTRGKSAQPPAITIDDSTTDEHTELVLRDSQELRALASEDVPLGALVSVVKPAESTTVTARGLTALTTAPGTGGVWLASPGVAIGGSDEIAAAIAAAPAVVATGDWVLARRGGVWTVQPLAAAPAPGLKRPELLRAQGSSGDVSGGTLPAATSLSYVVMARNAAGETSARSPIAPAMAGQARTVKLVVRIDAAPCELRIWRYRGGSTTPDAYLSIPCARPKVTLYDFGAHLSGYAWLPGEAGR